MSTIQLETARAGTNRNTTVSESSFKRPLLSSIRWSAVIAGVAVGISVQLLLTLFGIASGLSMTSVQEGEVPGVGTLLWAGIALLLSGFIGAYVTGYMCGLKRRTDGMLHGVVSWAVTTLLFVMLATSAGGSLLSGVFSGVGSTSNAIAQGGAAGVLRALISNEIASEVSNEAIRTLQQQLANGQRDQAIAYMSANFGLRRDQASAIVDQTFILSGSPERASVQGREAADRAIRNASLAAWLVFAAVVLSLALSLVGGALGTMTAKRTVWSEEGGASHGGVLVESGGV
ncbi:MAG: hypothetical protein EBZ75_15030 [Oxalobacteraceae bacterium]|nr:hypothetical protein [Oxalobacteraceae bacterium]